MTLYKQCIQDMSISKKEKGKKIWSSLDEDMSEVV